MQTDDVVVRVQVQDGTWEMLGADRAVQVVPESVALTANSYGSDTASFDLRRDPGSLWPDLIAFTPVEVEIGGEIVWSGRIKETPGREGDDPVINVQAEGWQYHLDDDVYAQSYVYTTVSDWRDMRTFPGARLNVWVAACQVSNDNGILTLAAPANVLLVNVTGAAVALDLGPYARAQRVVVTYDYANPNGSTNQKFTVAASNVSADDVNAAQIAQIGLNPTGSGTIAVNASAARYLQLSLVSLAGANLTPTGDIYVRITSIQVFGSTAIESGNASILKATDVVKDALTQATSKLSSDVSKVASTSFNIPDIHFPLDPKSPREAIDGVNALHNYITQVDVNKRMVFQPRPAAPIFEVGAWPGAVFEDSSMNSGQDVYNRVLVTGTGPDGTPVLVSRASSQGSNIVKMLRTQSGPWGAGGSPTPGDYFTQPLYPIYAGMPILVVLTPQNAAPNASYPNFGVAGTTITVTVGNSDSPGSEGYGDFKQFSFDAGQAGPLSFVWIPTKDHINTVQTRYDRAPTSTNGSMFMDIYRGTSILDRRGFQRTKVLPINAPIITSVANQVGDTYLTAHRTQPLTGTLTVTPGGVRHVLTGETIPPALLLANAGQLVRLGHRLNPDDGSVGRDGTIAAVSYTHDTREASVSIDSARNNFEALLQRFAVLSGGSAI